MREEAAYYINKCCMMNGPHLLSPTNVRESTLDGAQKLALRQSLVKRSLLGVGTCVAQ